MKTHKLLLIAIAMLVAPSCVAPSSPAIPQHSHVIGLETEWNASVTITVRIPHTPGMKFQNGLAYRPAEKGFLTALGSGTIISMFPRVEILTAYHVIAGAESILVQRAIPWGYDKKPKVSVAGTQFIPYHAQVVKESRLTDLALLVVEDSGIVSNIGRVPTLAPYRPSIGKRVFAIGNARGQGMRITEGIISQAGTRKYGYAPGLLIPTFSATCMMTNGCSGGGLFYRGQLIGVASMVPSSRGQQFGWMGLWCTTEAINDFLRGT